MTRLAYDRFHRIALLERVPVVLNRLFGVMAGLVPAIRVFLAESL